jgi:hypothetical protein
MNINEQAALSIAREFAAKEYKDSKFPLLLGEASVHLEQGGLGHGYFGLSKNYWSILFNLENSASNETVVDPDHVIVLVDSESGKAIWFPVM